MKTLTIKQRKFLEYLRDNHKSFGYEGTIRDVLHDGCYESQNTAYMNMIAEEFKADRFNYNKCKRYGGLPTKYLK